MKKFLKWFWPYSYGYIFICREYYHEGEKYWEDFATNILGHDSNGYIVSYSSYEKNARIFNEWEAKDLIKRAKNIEGVRQYLLKKHLYYKGFFKWKI